MENLNQDELVRLLTDLESDRAERKESAAERDKIRKTICAFSNDFPNHQKPGIIFIGANNDGTCATDYRNPLIAEAAKVLGYIQRFGMGIPLARRELKENGNPEPKFDFQSSHFMVTIEPAG